MIKPLPPAPNFFALLRHIEDAHPGRPMLGTSLRLRDDPLRLGQHPHLDFATQDFQREETLQSPRLGAVPKFYVQNFGLLGPNGALPLHYTEHAYTRVHQWNDRTFSEFLDVFHHRAYLLFYRAWAQAQPHIAYHRPLHNPFAHRLNSLVGHGAQTSWGREVLPTHFRAGLAGHFTRRTKTREGLACTLSTCTGQAVEVQPFVAQWLQLAPRAGLGLLGQGAMLGSRVWCAQSKITVHIGPMPYASYLRVLPKTTGRTQLVQATHAYLGLEFDCEFRLLIKPEQIPPARLNGLSQLGRTTWLGSPQGQLRRDAPAMVRVKCPAIPNPSTLSRSTA